MEYYSDKERGPKAQIKREIPPSVQEGIIAYIDSLIEKGAFGNSFPEKCEDGRGVYGTDKVAFFRLLKAEIPQAEWPLQRANLLDNFVVLDLIQFCYRYVAYPKERDFHRYYGHYHLSFDVDKGRKEFREEINLIFKRNGLAYELEDDGNIVRLGVPIISDELAEIRFCTIDPKLNEMLLDARRKYFTTKESSHKEAVERLWDAWERLKTIMYPEDKKKSIGMLLDKVASGDFRDLLEKEAAELTRIGNKFHIRHFEKGKSEIERIEHFDYLFHRMFSMILLLLKACQ